MYRAIYKCRLCGGEVGIPIYNQDAQEMAIAATEGNPFDQPVDYRQIHKCANGGRGIMDLQGFRLCENER